MVVVHRLQLDIFFMQQWRGSLFVVKLRTLPFFNFALSAFLLPCPSNLYRMNFCGNFSDLLTARMLLVRAFVITSFCARTLTLFIGLAPNALNILRTCVSSNLISLLIVMPSSLYIHHRIIYFARLQPSTHPLFLPSIRIA